MIYNITDWVYSRCFLSLKVFTESLFWFTVLQFDWLVLSRCWDIAASWYFDKNTEKTLQPEKHLWPAPSFYGSLGHCRPKGVRNVSTPLRPPPIVGPSTWSCRQRCFSGWSISQLKDLPSSPNIDIWILTHVPMPFFVTNPNAWHFLFRTSLYIVLFYALSSPITRYWHLKEFRHWFRHHPPCSFR